MPLQIAAECLSGCSGCEMALLDMGEALIELLSELDFVHMPILIDHKYIGPDGVKRPAIPEAEIGIVSGGIRTQEQLELATLMRERCRTIVAIGTCAGYGGVPALGNLFSNDEVFERTYGESGSSFRNGVIVLDRTYAVDEKIKVDFLLPGCPPHPETIEMLFRALVAGKLPVLPEKSVCDTCPVRREGKGAVKKIRMDAGSAQFEPGTSLGRMRCLLEQGILCMGPVTRGGCGGPGEQAPGCIAARLPCSGCYGPIRRNGNPLMDMLNALASNGIDVRDVPDRQGTFLRFTGAHGRLRRRTPRPGTAGRQV